MIQRALVSVSDKSGVLEFCQALASMQVEILSTGGTAKLLTDNGIDVIEVSAYTGFPEIMDGRVKTLHPRIHGGLLGRAGIDDAVMQEHGITAIDLVVVNLYPFEKTIAKQDCTLEEAIENIDIGGPSMLRAAAKNHARVGVVVDAADYESVLSELKEKKALSDKTRFRLAQKAFAHTANYDANVSNYLGSLVNDQHEVFPVTFTTQFLKKQDLRYGENPHQKAAFYTEPSPAIGSVGGAQQHQGKALSYNNIADTDAALTCVQAFTDTACVIVKHANPCGVATGRSVKEAYERAYATDPTSAFGGIIAFNCTLDAETARLIIGQQFVEVIIAPTVSDEALKVLKDKKSIRVLACGKQADMTARMNFKRVGGGLLLQDNDRGVITKSDLKIVSQRQPDEREISDMLFAWRVVKHVKSNAIVYVKDNQTIGVGAGQMSRIYSARIAAIKAADENLPVKGTVMASDAFFPFRDGIDAAAGVGVRAIIQPGGSVRDDEVIAAANEHDIAMVFTSMRHFLH